MPDAGPRAVVGSLDDWIRVTRRFDRVCRWYRARRRRGGSADVANAQWWFHEIGDPLQRRIDAGERTAALLEELRTVE